MRILALDQSLGHTGLVVATFPTPTIEYAVSVKPPVSWSHARKAAHLYEALRTAMALHGQIGRVAMEAVFVGQHASPALCGGVAQGVVYAACFHMHDRIDVMRVQDWRAACGLSNKRGIDHKRAAAELAAREYRRPSWALIDAGPQSPEWDVTDAACIALAAWRMTQ